MGVLERVPQKINERPPFYMGRDYMESLMASQHVDDWIQIRSVYTLYDQKQNIEADTGSTASNIQTCIYNKKYRQEYR